MQRMAQRDADETVGAAVDVERFCDGVEMDGVEVERVHLFRKAVSDDHNLDGDQ